jgi:predicted porin
MKHLPLALLLAGLSGAALAQSSVTIYGRFDVGYRWGNLSDTKWTQQAGQKSGSRLGFRGTEDLGNGLKAGFVIETGFAGDEGRTLQTGGTGSRQAYVSLNKSGLGEFRFGRQYSLLDDQASNYSPLSTSSYAYGTAGWIINDDQSRLNNAATFYSSKFSGWSFSLQGATAETSSDGVTTDSTTGDTKAHYAGAVQYANGPLTAGLTLSKNYGNDTNRSINNEWLAQLGATYDFGPFKLYGQYEYDGTKDNYGVTGSNSFGDNNSYLVGVSVPSGPWVFKAGLGYSENANRSTKGTVQGAVKQLTFAADYSLSKRTVVYAGAGWLKGDYDSEGTKDGQRNAKQVVTGILHFF